MRRLVMMPIVLASLFLFPVEVATAQAPKYSRVDTNAIHALWVSIKRQLTAPNGQEYFTNALQNADLPLLIGTLLSPAPNEQPSSLVLNMSDGLTPEVTLHLKDNNANFLIRFGVAITCSYLLSIFSSANSCGGVTNGSSP